MNLFEHFNAQTVQQVSDMWPNSHMRTGTPLLYRGQDLFKLYCEGPVADQIRVAAMTLGIDEGEQLDGQEVLLTYHRQLKQGAVVSSIKGEPLEDFFTSGWDVWGDKGLEGAAVIFKISDSGELTILDVDRTSVGIYNREQGIYKMICGADKRNDNERLDIRLD